MVERNDRRWIGKWSARDRVSGEAGKRRVGCGCTKSGKQILIGCLRKSRKGLQSKTDKQQRPEHGDNGRHRLPHFNMHPTRRPPHFSKAELILIRGVKFTSAISLCFVSGHDFSRAAKAQKRLGL